MKLSVLSGTLTVMFFLRLSAFEDVEGGLDVDATLNLVRRVDLDAGRIGHFCWSLRERPMASAAW